MEDYCKCGYNSCRRFCYNIRCAVFLSEGGVECVTANKKELLTCVKKSVPEAFSPVQRRRNANNMHFYVFQKENCR